MTSAHATTNRRGVVGAWASSLSHGAPVADVERSADWVLASPPTAAGASSMEESTRSVRARGVAEPSRALAGVVPPGHLVGALGPRPVAASHQRTWREAADVIDRYRTTWHVDDRAEALGSANALHLMSTRQLADRVRTGRQVEEARTRLGLHRATDLERANPRERASQLPWASRPEPATHSLGRD
jgi:hypothetical protein